MREHVRTGGDRTEHDTGADDPHPVTQRAHGDGAAQDGERHEQEGEVEDLGGCGLGRGAPR